MVNSRRRLQEEGGARADWPTYSFLGVSIVFPFEAYECQRRFMEGMVQAMRQSQNALLESPTGTGWGESRCCFLFLLLPRAVGIRGLSTSVLARTTGKTMCLLSAALGWRESERQQGRDPPKIVYATRTHSQISQIMEELEKTYYAKRGQCTAVAVGSREQLCVHQQVWCLQGRRCSPPTSREIIIIIITTTTFFFFFFWEQVKKLKGTSQVSACRTLVKQNKCRHYNKLRKDSSSASFAAKNVLDIEDLHTVSGENGGCCPYYSSRKLQTDTDVLVLPYNYLVDPSLRHSLTADIRDGVVIFDEGHNIVSRNQ